MYIAVCYTAGVEILTIGTTEEECREYAEQQIKKKVLQKYTILFTSCNFLKQYQEFCKEWEVDNYAEGIIQISEVVDAVRKLIVLENYSH